MSASIATLTQLALVALDTHSYRILHLADCPSDHRGGHSDRDAHGVVQS
eukprot:XP_001704152.1 Hypothetical protein GL50803_22217 [Giardia lamblia ATCC 50803]